MSDDKLNELYSQTLQAMPTGEYIDNVTLMRNLQNLVDNFQYLTERVQQNERMIASLVEYLVEATENANAFSLVGAKNND